MGAKCLRASEDYQGEDEKASSFGHGSGPSSSHRENVMKPRVSPRWILDPPAQDISREGEEGDCPSWQGETQAAAWGLGAPADRRNSRPLAKAPVIQWSRAPQVLSTPVPVMLHVYNIGAAGVGRALNRILKPLGTGVFHCGVEVYGCEWSYSDTTTGLGDGVFPSKPTCCDGHDYCETLLMGQTTTTEDEVAKLIRLLKKEWPVAEYDTLKRNCCHFSNELCQRLGVGSIPGWVMNLAGAGAAIAASGDLTCCRQVAVQVGKSCCCAGGGGGDGEDSVEVVDVVDQIAVLPPRRQRQMSKGQGNDEEPG